MSGPVQRIRPNVVPGFEKMLSGKEVALILGQSERWVRNNLLKPGRLPNVRVGNKYHIRPVDFERWLRDNTNRGEKN